MIIKIILLLSLVNLIKCKLNFKIKNENSENLMNETLLYDNNDNYGLQVEAEGFNYENLDNKYLSKMSNFESALKKDSNKLPSFLNFSANINKIQSNSKNIEYNNNFMYDKNIIVEPKIPEKYLNENPSNNEKGKHETFKRKSLNINEFSKKSLNSKSLLLRRKSVQSVSKAIKSKLRKIHLAKQNNHRKITLNKFRRRKQNQYPMNEQKFRNIRHRGRRAVTAKKERIWDHGVIPYDIDKIFNGNHKALFIQAMRHWENFTCIKFIERDPRIHANYIYFTVRNCGCCSFVGKRGNGRQAISIGRNCEKFGIIVHELGHVIGFWHEHTRIDRDRHISINRGNILKGQEYNFNILSPEDVDSLGLPYDYKSIMHYARNTFSKNVYLDTIEPIHQNGNDKPDIGQRLHLSNGDINQANLLYKCTKCGRTFQQSSGEIQSPNYNIKSINMEHEHCEWRIQATHGERIILKIYNLNLFKLSDNCDNDYLEIRDGYWLKSPIIKRFCGNLTNVNQLIQTDSSRMLLTYVNRNLMKGYKGFTADFEVMCGGVIFVNDTRRIDSPNYPLEYLSERECTWTIYVPDDYEVALKFQSFELENQDNCIYDYVEVRDGDNANSELIGVFCGYKLPPNIKTTSNKMYIKFVSDNSVQKIGFSATVMKEIDECKLTNHGCQHECINTLGGYECNCFAGFELQSDGKLCEDACGGIIQLNSSTLYTTLSSPSYPDLYPPMKDCIWEIHAPNKYNVFINFTHFDLEGSKYQFTECNYDYIKLYSKLKEKRLKHIGNYCGNELPSIINSDKNILRLEFHSDKSIQHYGFLANILIDVDECSTNNGGCQHYCKNTLGSYKCTCKNGYTLNENNRNCTETKCKFEITSPYGIIQSPSYPEDYPRNAYCYWHFITIPGHRIQLTFHDFEIENHQECIYDHVGIYDGHSENSSTLGVYCGGREPYTPVLASTNEMYLVLRTDGGFQKKGFMAVHSTECGGYLRATNETKHFYSHARYGHRPYKKDMYCIWRIQTDSDSSVKLNFMSFSIEYSEKCDYDYVQVTEEFNSKKSIHGKFCGNQRPPNIISYSDTLIIKFKSDDSTTLKGFAASYGAVEPPELTDDANNDYDDTVTPFPGYHKSIYYDDYDDNNYSKN